MPANAGPASGPPHTREIGASETGSALARIRDQDFSKRHQVLRREGPCRYAVSPLCVDAAGVIRGIGCSPQPPTDTYDLRPRLGRFRVSTVVAGTLGTRYLRSPPLPAVRVAAVVIGAAQLGARRRSPPETRANDPARAFPRKGQVAFRGTRAVHGQVDTTVVRAVIEQPWLRPDHETRSGGRAVPHPHRKPPGTPVGPHAHSVCSPRPRT